MKKLQLYWWVLAGILGNVNLVASNIFVTNTNNSGAGSFQNAVNLAFNDPSQNTIRFDLPPGSIIYPTDQIWMQGNGDIIDGQLIGTQERIIFDGINFNLGDAWALIVNCSSCTVQNVEMRNFSYTAMGVWEVSDILLRDNVLYGNKTGIQVDGGSQNVSVESNIIGVNANMVNTQSEASEDYGIWIGEAYNVFIAGNIVSGLGEADGGNVAINIGIVMDTDDVGSGITVTNNRIGVDQSGFNTLPNHMGVWVGSNKSDVEIYNNILSGNKDSGLIISGVNISVYDNNIGYDITGQNALPSDTTGIWIGNDASNISIYRNQIAGNNISTWGIYCQNITNVSLGTDNENDENEITSCNVGIGLLYNGEVEFGVNELSCNSFPIWFQSQDGMAIPEITNASSSNIQGTAPPNTTVDIYAHNDSGCNNVLCQGKEYLGSTLANSLGNWSLSGLSLLSNTQVTAIAASGSSMSNYASCEVVSGGPAFCECQSISCSILDVGSVIGQTNSSCSNAYTDYGCISGLSGPEDIYKFHSSSGQDIYFELNSFSELYVMVMDDCPSSATCLDYLSNSEGGKVITIPAGGAYLVVDGPGTNGTDYTLSYNCDIQPPQPSSCDPAPAFTDFYQNDAEVLAAVQMINDPAYSSTVEIPSDLFDFYYNRLNAIFNATGIPERDTVVECLNIHTESSFFGFSTTAVDIEVIPGTSWAQQLINGVFPTSNASVNNLILLYGLTLESYYQPAGFNWRLNLQADHNLNTRALANQFLNIAGVEDAFPSSFVFTGGGPGYFPLFFDIQNGYTDLHFQLGWDCFAGICAGVRSWTFRVFDDCSVQFLLSDGNALDPSVGCNNGYQCAIDPLCLPWMKDTLIHYTPPSTTPYCIPNDPIFSYGLSKYTYNGYEVFGIGWGGFDTWETRFYNCEGDYLGINYNYDGTGGISEPSSLPAYEYETTLWDCEDELPLCNNCPTDPQEILCLDWLQQSPLGEEGVSYNEQEGIIILINLATGGEFWYSFFDCSGQLLHECAGNNINDPTVNCNSYYNSLVQNAIELLGPLEPFPDCASPPWNPQACASGNTHFINVIYEDLESEIGGQPLQEGDWLGLFYEQDDGTLVCMDQAQFTDPAQENGFQLRGCEESSPGADDGFAADEPFQFKIFKDGVEYDAGTLSVTFWGEGEIIPPVFPDATSRFLGDGRQSAIRSIRDFPDIEDPSCDTPIPIACGQSHSGNNTDGTDNALSYNCFTNVVDGPEVIYAFTLDQTEDVLITLNGLSDDLELLLLDECDRDHCIAVSERTGASAETILYEDLAPGEYIIVVEGYIGFESDYTLSLDCGDFPQGGFSCTPEEISCDETINSTTADGCSDVNFYNCSDSYTPGREKVYRIRFSQPENVRITLTPQGGDLELFLLDALDPNRCIYFSTESGDEIERILLDDNEIIPNRDYYIVVDEYGGDAGINFQLQVECVPDGPPCPWCPPPPGFCDNADEITCGMAVNGHTQNGDSRVEKWGDCPSFNVGPELIYAFNNPVTQDVQINLSGFSENLNFYVLRDQCAVSACYEGWAGNKSGLINESILITPMPAGQYYIVVDSYDAASAFTLEVKCQETDNCFELDVPAGYSYISSNRRPGDTTIENVVPPGQFQGISLILSDEWGNIYDPNFPTPGAPNRIGNWETTDGYRIDVSENVTLEFCGEEADPEASRAVIAQITTGQIQNNIIGYPFQEPLTVEEAFAGSPTEGLSSIEYRYPSGSQASESYIFSLQLGTNFTMSPGNGYLLKVAQDGAFSFRGPEGGSAFMPNGCTYFRTPMRNTMERAFIRVPVPSVSGTMEAGDELGLFNENGLLCGSGKYLGEQFIITLLGDENATAASEGFVPGEMMYARIWSASTGKTREVSLQFSESEAVYAHNQIYQLNGLSGISSTQSYASLTWQLYPNPAGERLYLEYQLPDAQAISVRLIAANGQVQAQYEWNLEAGVNQNSIDLSQLPGGIYFVQLATDGATETRKIVVQH